MTFVTRSIGLLLLGAASAAGAQLLPGLPPVPGVVGGIVRPVDDALQAASTRAARTLDAARLDRVAELVRSHPDVIAIDPDGFAARAHEIVIDDPEPAVLSAATARGYVVIERSDLLGIGFARLRSPSGTSLTAAIRMLRKLGAKQVSADQLHFASGTTPPTAPASAPPANPGRGAAIGVIDGGVASHVAAQRGFATGAPRASNHGAAVASLILGAGPVRGVAPDAQLYSADVYGSDPAGGNATAIAKAIAWLTIERVPVVTISLVGPPNPLLARVVTAAQARGVIFVAAVGNDGPAAPPSYPASYPGVIAVTGVDGSNRILIEAGRATHLDYAAPGADMLAATSSGASATVRGTSFAAPLVAATILAAYPAPDPAARRAALAKVDGGAHRMGARYGRGLVCERCRTPTK